MKNASSDSFPLLATPPSIPWLHDVADQYFVGDIDGDGYDEVILYNPYRKSIAAVKNFQYGELTNEWANDKQHKLITFWHSSGDLFATAQEKGFLFGANISISFADIDGDGQNEVILKNEDKRQVLVMKWGKGENGFYQFNKVALFTGKLTNDLGIHSSDQLYFSDVTGNGAEEMMIYSYSSNSFSTLTWNVDDKIFINLLTTTKFINPNLTSTSVGYERNPDTGYLKEPPLLIFGDFFNMGFNFLFGMFADPKSSGAILGCFSFGFPKKNTWNFMWNKNTDLSLSDNIELLTSNFTSTASPDAIVAQSLPEMNNVLVFSNSIRSFDYKKRLAISPGKLYSADVDGDGYDELILKNSDSREVDVLKWNETYKPTPIFKGIDYLGENKNWTINLVDQFYFGKFSSKSKYDAIGIKIIGVNYHGLFSWTKKQDGNLLSNALYIAKSYIRPYNMTLIANGPSKLFSKNPFTGQQLTFYNYINANLPELNGATVRSTYNEVSHPPYLSIANEIEKLAPPAGIKNDNPDWILVTTTLRNELASCFYTTQRLTYLQKSIIDIKDNMNQALTNIKGIKFEKPKEKDEVLFWIEQIFIAAVWGISAAFTGGASVAIAIGASVLGSLSTAFDGQEGPIKIKWNVYQSEIDTNIENAKITLSDNFYVFFNDINKLPIIGKLITTGGPWDVDKTIPNQRQVTEKAIHSYQAFFYQQIFPTIDLGIGSWILNGVWGTKIPQYDFFKRSAEGMGYMLIIGTKPAGVGTIPEKALIDDLFKTIKEDEDNIIHRRLGWKNLPHIFMKQN